jgi:predicted enzyme related to lactoylglutathione lyase
VIPRPRPARSPQRFAFSRLSEPRTGNHRFRGLDTFVAVEAAKDSPPGTVTIWIRIEDVNTSVDAFLREGATVVRPPASNPYEKTATIVTASGIRIGLIT